ncbi:CDP-alcohol phosphatidyltransferase family protein [Sporosalibacterium faouarense]|uniref:CDP-alcohol phosphatidyltransferase family protein n=1 Tax=Sporosalibacterium faouarense TaxID=516123 RepID=UPI00141C7DE4|nr:CDP-alcohol phosphatidyltransferase family protein [Sporosalibacterium faouarense]MTI48768.1 CDP-alcohol phosphatidyltransferase family protein [Bacillota bacterium]
MLDTHARRYVSPVIRIIAKAFLKYNISANQITILAFLIGVLTGPLIYFDFPILACIFLWISGLLDAVDGAVARMKKNITAWGTLMDITFDRIVELAVIIGLAFKYTNIRIELLMLTSAIIFSMTIFLTVGALTEKKGEKSFYYQAGVAERTEGFILLSIMILFNNLIVWSTIIFTILVTITAFQRMIEAKRIFDTIDKNK